MVRASCQLQQTCTALHDVCAEGVYKAKDQWGHLYQNIRISAILEENHRNCRFILGMPWPRQNKKYQNLNETLLRRRPLRALDS